MNPDLSASRPTEPPPSPWWRFPIVWLVIGGPAVVVVASIVTAVVAWRGADDVLVETPAARGATATTRPTATTAALTARNHAATPADR